MNLRHLSTFLWLRWRLLINGVKRAGTANAVITSIFGVIALFASLVLFVGGVVLGAFGFPNMPDVARLFVWVGIIALFLFFWLIGLLATLQRSEALSLEKVLFMPVSPSGAFLVNYLSSFMSLTLILFVPGMIGLAIGEVYSTGRVMLLAFPLLFAFVFVCTAMTYQFQGWLASLMSNPRRRRTVIVLLGAGIMILVQVPNMVSILKPWDKVQIEPATVSKEQMEQLQKKFQSGEIASKDYIQQKQLLDKEEQQERNAAMNQLLVRSVRITRVVCGILPPGWVALGMADLADGHVIVALGGTLGLCLLGTLSLMRTYRTTILMYTNGGSRTDGQAKAVPVATAAAQPDERPSLLEWKLPWISEYAAAVALAGFRSLLRAPEAKMQMLLPLILLVMFVGGFASTNVQSETFGPFVIFGFVGMMLAMIMQFIGNMFGFDRDGFRTFVLSPIPRREILLGKNLTLAPLVLGLGLLVVTGAGFVVHLRWDQFLAAYFQLFTMYLLFSLLGNVCAIYATFMIPSGSLKGTRPRLSVVLVQFACMMISPCVVGIPTVLPSGIELALYESGVAKGVPVSLGFSVVIFAASLASYRGVLAWQGQLLADREQQILEAVTRKME